MIVVRKLVSTSTEAGQSQECSTLGLVYRNGRPRFQRSIRRGDRVTTEYLASGDNALLFASIDVLTRAEQEGERADEEAEIEALKAAEQPLIDYVDTVEDLARAALYAIGYHEHKSEWRKRRGNA